MAKAKPSPAARSKGKTNPTPQSSENRRSSQGTPPRAHRDDTPEARQQRSGTPKTHPTRSPAQARKDDAQKHPKR